MLFVARSFGVISFQLFPERSECFLRFFLLSLETGYLFFDFGDSLKDTITIRSLHYQVKLRDSIHRPGLPGTAGLPLPSKGTAIF